ncbi:MAG: HEAT repeat domain-containing protein [Candidatus Micrarchaeota archaeon]
MDICMNSRAGMHLSGTSKDWSKVHIREDGELRKPRATLGLDRQEVLDLMRGVRWEHIRRGIAEAALGKNHFFVQELAYLAKHGCSENLGAQLSAMREQFRGIEARLAIERMEAEGKVGGSTMSLLIPAVAMSEIRASPDPRATAMEWRERLAIQERVERRLTGKRAVEALGEIGSPAAIAELVKLLFCTDNNMDMWAASALNHAASENPEKVLPVLKEAIRGLAGRDDADKAVEILKAACGRMEGQA